MQKIFIITILCLTIVASHECVCQIKYKKDSAKVKLYEDLKSFVGRPFYEFLVDDRVRLYKELAYFTEPPGRLSGAYVVLDSSVTLKVYFRALIAVRISGDGSWDKHKTLIQEIALVEIVKEGENKIK